MGWATRNTRALEILMTQEHLALLQKTRENLSEVLAAMNIEILRFRKVVDRAADGSMTSRLLVRWTEVLAITTSGLMLATLALLVYASLIAGH